jgi:hypothetical protein
LRAMTLFHLITVSHALMQNQNVTVRFCYGERCPHAFSESCQSRVSRWAFTSRHFLRSYSSALFLSGALLMWPGGQTIEVSVETIQGPQIATERSVCFRIVKQRHPGNPMVDTCDRPHRSTPIGHSAPSKLASA